jgi:hypothetical protein
MTRNRTARHISSNSRPRRTSHASIDSGVTSSTPRGTSRNRRLRLCDTSPCQACTGMPSASHSLPTLIRASLMRAFNGTTMTTLGPVSSRYVSRRHEAIGIMAASVLPDAVGAHASTSRPSRTGWMHRDWTSRRVGHPCSAIHACTSGCSRPTAGSSGLGAGKGMTLACRWSSSPVGFRRGGVPPAGSASASGKHQLSKWRSSVTGSGCRIWTGSSRSGKYQLSKCRSRTSSTAPVWERSGSTLVSLLSHSLRALINVSLCGEPYLTLRAFINPSC